jgi:hypothetical protein
VLRGAGQGIVQGASETEADVTVAVEAAVKAATQEAAQADISGEEAAAHLARGALEAAIALGPVEVAEVEASLTDEVAEKAEAMTSDEEADRPPASDETRGAP